MTMSPLLIAVMCFVAAAVLAAADLLVPSGGALAIASLLAALASIYFAFQSSYQTGVIMLTLILICIPIFIIVALKWWAHTPIGKLVVLKTPPEPDQPVDSEQQQLQELVGQVGVAQSPLMPYGFVKLHGRSYNAMCDSGYVEAGQNVMVNGVQQRNLVVAATSLAPSSAPTKKTLEPETANENLLDRPANELGIDSWE
jgi:membrane-bound ClpP family serine protease